MADRRMFSKKIIKSDAFLDMPLSAHALYFHLAMEADDDGFVNNPKKVQREIGASEDDCRLLIAKRFIISFDSGVIVIKHWRVHNSIRADRYHPTLYQREAAQIVLDGNRGYTLIKDSNIEGGIPLGNHLATNGCRSIGEERIGKSNIRESAGARTHTYTYAREEEFIPPTADEVRAFCSEKQITLDADRFVRFYASKGWMIGKNKMQNWRSCAENWAAMDKTCCKESKQSSFDVDDMFNAALKKSYGGAENGN